jgi:uncharacterized damage-inducible protein DinB
MEDAETQRVRRDAEEAQRRQVNNLCNMKFLFGLLFSSCFVCVKGQDNLGEIIKQQMLKDWQRAKVYTQEYLDAMPKDKYQFKPVDSTRSFAQQMLHLAFGNVAMVTFAASIPDSNFQNVRKWQRLEDSSIMQNKDSVVYYVNKSYDFVVAAIKNLNTGKYAEIIDQRTPGGLRSETRLTWIMKAFEHQTHHRGQCTIYIRLLGIKPPAEKLF